MPKDDKVTEFDFKQAKIDDRNLTKAGQGWKEDSGDEAIEFMKGIREDTEED